MFSFELNLSITLQPISLKIYSNRKLLDVKKRKLGKYQVHLNIENYAINCLNLIRYFSDFKVLSKSPSLKN